MIKELVLGTVSVTALFMNNPEGQELLNPLNNTIETPYNLSEQMTKEQIFRDTLSPSERLIFMEPAKPESEDAKRLKESVKREMEEKEQARAQSETERLTLEEQEKTEKEWLENFPIFEGDSAEAKFLNEISRDAVEIAYRNDIYPSVMMAQAGLESSWGRSGLAKKHNNLMGTKGSWNGKTTVLRTREEVSGQSVYINANFSVYDSWADSLERYGQLLRNGPGRSSNFYAGTWRSNTASYKDATQWLQGRYATDGQYASKLNRVIERYDLARFDKIIPLDEELKQIEVIIEPEVIMMDIPKGMYEVQEGDSLFSIAFNYNLKVKDLIQMNALQSPLLEEKQWLIVEWDEFVNADEDEVEVLKEMENMTLKNTPIKRADDKSLLIKRFGVK